MLSSQAGFHNFQIGWRFKCNLERVQRRWEEISLMCNWCRWNDPWTQSEVEMHKINWVHTIAHPFMVVAVLAKISEQATKDSFSSLCVKIPETVVILYAIAFTLKITDLRRTTSTSWDDLKVGVKHCYTMPFCEEQWSLCLIPTMLYFVVLRKHLSSTELVIKSCAEL